VVRVDVDCMPALGSLALFRCGMEDVQKRITRNTDAAERWNSMLCEIDGWIERG
jgi:hypothetical protein